MKRAKFFLIALTLLAWATSAAETETVPSAKALRGAFETVDGKVWTLPADATQASRIVNAPAGQTWDFRTVTALTIRVERSNSVGGSARLRWLVGSRVGGMYLGPSFTLPSSGAANPSVNFAAESGDLTPVGHQRPWDALAAADVASLELRVEYTPGVIKSGSSGPMTLALSRVQLSQGKAAPGKPEVIDLQLNSLRAGNSSHFVLSFRLNPLPTDPYAATGEGDVRVKFSDGSQALAFLDQDAIETYDGAAMRLAAVGSPVWRAHLSAWPASGTFEIVSGKNTWSMPCSVVSAESASSLKVPTVITPPSTSRTMGLPRPPQPLARLRWETPLEASAPLLVANWTGSASYWALNPGGAWVPFEATRMLGLYSLPATAAPSDAASKKVWRPVPFWDETWGGYAGARRPDSALARSMDALLNAAAIDGETRPLILFDGASLERQGVFNWASHPLRSKLAGPGDIFRTEEGFDFCARWMRYCLARYASSPAVSSLLITTDLNAPGASEFHARLAPLLKEWRAGSSVQKPLVSFHPLAQPAYTVKDIGSFDSGSKSQDAAWHLDQRLSRAYGKLIERVGLGGGRCFEASVIESTTTTLALQNTYNLEYSDWRKPADDNFFSSQALMFEVWTPPDAPHDLRVGIHVRDRNGNWFQTLLPGMIRPGDWTTFALDITAANAHGLTAIDHRTTWTDYSRQRLQEIGLHLYSTHPRFKTKVGRIQNLTARFDTIRGVVFPQIAPEPTTTITLIDPKAPASPFSAAKSVARGELVEYHVAINKAFENPYDARSCDLMAIVTTPSGKKVRVPAFFNQLCERREATPGGDEIVESVGGEFFTVRYRALETGVHALAFELREGGTYDIKKHWEQDDRFSTDGVAQVATNRRWPYSRYPNHNPDGRRTVDKIAFVPGHITATLDLGAKAFSVTESEKPFHGFVRVAKDKRHFEFDDGSFFFPIGPCLRSPSDTRVPYRSDKFNPDVINKLGKRGTYQYDEYFDAFGKAGISWARVWMCSWWGALEWRRDWPGYQGLGRYNLQNAWRMDYVIDLAEKKDIRLNVAVTNHGQFTLDIDTEWKNNPYNAKLGGPLPAPCEIFTRADAKISHQNKLRYIAARYGHSPAVMAFALFSELEFTEEYERSLNLRQRGGADMPAPHIESWHAEMASFLKNMDPNRHLVATHFSHPVRGEGTLMVPEIDIATSNAYSAFDELAGGGNDAGAALHDFWMGNEDGSLKGFHIFNKPALVEEQGRHWMGMDAGKETNTKSELDADLHAGLWGSMAVPLSGATGYWWWLHIHFDNRYGDYTALRKFMDGEDFRPIGDEPAMKPVFRAVGKTALLGRAMKSDRRMYVWVYHQMTPLGDGEPEPVSGAKLNIGGLRPGKYSVEYWDTYKGVKTGSMDFEFVKDQANLEIALPTVNKDIAIKIKPKP